jgi:DNA-binding winged helix-turn-helix (wHTH) protein/tetratricopeptide (TPR) repeat protein
MKRFQTFRLDARNQCLWHGEQRVPLAPKAFDVLRYLVENPGRLVTQEEILDALWPEVYVNQEVIKKYILGIRKVLGDRHDQPTFIETIPRRGYQFIAKITEERGHEASSLLPDVESKIVGRETALAKLDDSLDQATRGKRQLLFISGEAGIGKTTLVDLFQLRAAQHEGIRIARGQCVEGFGGKEAYYPVLEAVGQLIRFANWPQIVEALSTRAPTWLIQFPSLLNPEQRAALQREIQGATRERMVREICEALEVLTVDHPLVLVLEDLHWVDPSTLDVIAALARRREAAKLLVLCTYRPSDIGVPSGLKRLKSELLIHQLCSEVALETLDESAVAAYLRREFDGGNIPSELSRLVYRNSGGNPLFLTALVQELVNMQMVVRKDVDWVLTKPLSEIAQIVPETLRQMLEVQFVQLDVLEQDILRSASVAGERFSVWAIAATLEVDTDQIEDTCEKLADRLQFIRPLGIHELRGGEFSAHYEFRHALYRDLLYSELSDVAKSRLHRLLARKLESIDSPTNPEIASEIAMHYERGFDHENAIKFMIVAAGNAAYRFAYRDSIQILRNALELVHRVQLHNRSSLELRILELIGDTYYCTGLMFDSAATYQTQVDYAARVDKKAEQVHALGCLAMPLGFLDPDRGLVGTRRAVQLSVDLNDPLLLSRSRLMSAGYSLVYDAWRESDWEVWKSNFKKADVLSEDPLPLYHSSLHSYLLLLQGDHRRVLDDLKADSRKNGEPYNLINDFFSVSAKTIALLFSGRFGELLRVLREGQERATKNGNDPWLFNFREAWLRILTFDYKGAYQLCADISGGSAPYPTGQPETLARLAQGYADIQKRQYERAIGTFEEIIDPQITPKFFLHWYWRMHANLAIGNAWLASGSVDKARIAADRFLEAALSTAEPNLNALAWDLQAKVAVAENNLIEARMAIKQGLEVLENFDLPVNAWILNATASDLELVNGNSKTAEIHRSLAEEQILAQAYSFEPDEPLRQSFLASGPVRRILASRAFSTVFKPSL